jgi:hypothetical protein
MLIPTDQHEAAVGDLLEEFSDRARVSELMTARRWFWHQTWKTIGHFLLGQFRETPVATAATIVSALFLLYYAAVPANLAIQAILANYNPYDYVNATAFWFFFNIPIAGILTPLLIGWLTSTISKGRETAVMLSVSLVGAAPFACVILAAGWYQQHPPPWFRYFSTPPGRLPWAFFRGLVLRTLLPPVSFLIGGMLGKLTRGHPKAFLPTAGPTKTHNGWSGREAGRRSNSRAQ